MSVPSNTKAELEAALASAAKASHGLFDRALVLDEAKSTQDEAKALSGRHGLIVAALHQTAGRGTHGRVWSSASHHGLAITFVCPGLLSTQGKASLTAGIAAASACRASLNPTLAATVGLKWPNDVVAASNTALLKLGGVLIEANADTLLVGIGINVSQTPSDFPPELAGHATSLHQLGSTASRATVAESLTRHLAALWTTDDGETIARWRSLDQLTGRPATLQHDNSTFTGVIESIDPLEAIALRTDDGSLITLPARSTSVIKQ